MNLLRNGAAAALLLAGTALPAAAQNIPAVRVGQTVNGTLTEADPAPTDRGRFKVYRFDAAAGRPYLITMRSSDFDAYLRVVRNVGGITDVLKEDDDRGGGTDARLRFTAKEAGSYLVVAQALEGEGRGAFTLQLEEAPRPTTATPRPVRLGERVSGRLADTDAVEDDETFYDSYTLQGRPGQRLQVEMASDSFDTYLNLGRMQNGQFASKRTDDDGAGEGTNSRLRVTLDQAGEYVLRATSLGPATGPYTLVVTERPAVPAPRAVAVQLGTDVRGSLADGDAETDEGSPFDLYTLRGAAGDRLTITLASQAFDAVVAIGRMVNGAFVELESNDDGDDGTNSRLEYTLPEGGEYVIRASALSAGSTGEYTLNVSR
jgi:hypothetical protein